MVPPATKRHQLGKVRVKKSMKLHKMDCLDAKEKLIKSSEKRGTIWLILKKAKSSKMDKEGKNAG